MSIDAPGLRAIPNIGPAGEADLRLLGIDTPAQLKGRDAMQLYAALCEASGQRHDPCVIDVFMAAIHFVETGEARPWWAFTAQRKRLTGSLASRR
ncbi:helix-hairpin-helix domain-containing protein [Chitinimonas sp.]|uniref:helix-hairpin-helix domain-containing protein n=1 Tax=Chitinimonas sp. TaxID=1934313 RepID=UPI0035B18C06